MNGVTANRARKSILNNVNLLNMKQFLWSEITTNQENLIVRSFLYFRTITTNL